jgi:hypothetical protein
LDILWLAALDASSIPVQHPHRNTAEVMGIVNSTETTVNNDNTIETQTGLMISSAANEPTAMLSDELEFSRAESYETASAGLENMVTVDHTETGESEDQDFGRPQRSDVHKVNETIGSI